MMVFTTLARLWVNTTTLSENLSAPGAGLISFGIDLVNKVPGVNM